MKPENVSMSSRLANKSDAANRIQQSAVAVDGTVTEKERAARAALQSSAGRVFSDSEWQQVRSRCLEYASILRAWQRKETTPVADLPKAA